MATLRDLEEDLLRCIQTAIADLGFGRRSQDFAFDAGSVTNMFHVSFVRHPDDVDITLDVAVRHHAVEQLLDETDPDRAALTKRERRERATAGAEIGNLAGAGQRRWTMAVPDDVATVCKSIASVVRSVGLAYFDRFGDLERLLDVLARDDEEAWLHCPFHDVRAKACIAAASVLGRNTCVPSSCTTMVIVCIAAASVLGRNTGLSNLVTKKREYLAGRHDPGLESFEAVAAALLNRAI